MAFVSLRVGLMYNTRSSSHFGLATITMRGVPQHSSYSHYHPWLKKQVLIKQRLLCEVADLLTLVERLEQKSPFKIEHYSLLVLFWGNVFYPSYEHVVDIIQNACTRPYVLRMKIGSASKSTLKHTHTLHTCFGTCSWLHINTCFWPKTTIFDSELCMSWQDLISLDPTAAGLYERRWMLQVVDLKRTDSLLYFFSIFYFFYRSCLSLVSR